MGTRLKGRLSLLVFAIMVTMLAFPAMAFAQAAPTIQSDKDDYSPGATVTLTGSNWQAGEAVHIFVNDDEGQTWSYDKDVTADASGNLTDQFNLPSWFVARYSVKATGASGAVATSSFTDGNVSLHPAPAADGVTQYRVTYDLWDKTSTTCGGAQHNSPNPSSTNQTLTVTSPNNTNIPGFGGTTSSALIKSVDVLQPATGKTFDKWTSGNNSTDSGNALSSPVCVTNDNGGGGSGNLTDLYAHFKASNQAPVANSQSVSTNEDASKLITLSATDADNNTLSYKVTSLPTNGKLYKGNSTNAADEIKSADLPFTLPGGGAQVTYVPNADYNNTAATADTFKFKANDGTVDSNEATVSVTVNPVNDVPVASDDTRTMNEDGGPLSIDFGALVSDVETSDANLTYNVSAPNPSGSLSGTGSTRNFTPAADFNGTVTINYTVTDRGDPDNCSPVGPSCDAPKTSAQKTVTVNVTAVNDAPVNSVPGNQSTNEDTALTFNTANNNLISISDIDAGSNAVKVTLGVTHGKLTLSGTSGLTFAPGSSNGTANMTFTGTITDLNSALSWLKFDPDANYNGPAALTITTDDQGNTGSGGAKTDSDTVNITVNAVNDAPVASDDSYNTDEDTQLQVAAPGVLGNDSDVDSANLTAAKVVGSGPSHGTLTFNANGSFTYNPDANYNGPDSFKYKANDGSLDSSEATVSITVKAVNDAPVAVDDTATTDEDTAAVINVVANDTDVDNTKAELSVVAGSLSTPAHGTAELITLGADAGKVRYTPNANYNGTDSFKYKVSDGTAQSNEATVSITVNAINDAPVAKDDSATTNEDTATDINVVANDTDVDNTTAELSVSSFTQPSHGTVSQNNDGTLHYEPAANYNGPDSFTYRAKDASLESNEATVSVTVNAVNDAPVAKDDTAETNEDTPLSIDVVANDTDVDNANSELSVSSFDHTSAHGGAVSLDNGKLNYEPAANYNGPDSFKYKVSDGNAQSNEATVSIDVKAVNDAPVAKDDEATTNEDTKLTVNAPGVLGNDEDVDSANLSAVQVTGPAHGQLTLSADGSFEYMPDSNYNGSDSFTYKANDGSLDSNVATVKITINAVNDAPVAVDNKYTTNEDETLNVGEPGLLGNDTDVENDPLHVADGNANAADGISPVSGPDHGMVNLNADGSFSYNPAADYNGSDLFTYRVCDNGSPEPKCSVETAKVDILINAVNDAPVAVNDAKTTPEDTATDINVTANDTDVDNANSELSVSTFTQGTHGSVSENPDGTLHYKPNDNFNGTDTFTYKVKDASNLDSANSATVTITVTAVNDAPVANPESYSTDEDQTLSVPAVDGVLKNDTDVENDPLTAVLVTGPTHGQLTLNNDGSFTYKPDANYNGSDTFQYRASDGTDNSNLATVSITVRPVNDAPVAKDDSATTDEDTPTNIAVLSNDTDVDGDALSASSFTQPSHGTVSAGPNGTLHYEPAANYNGPDSFKYKAKDASLESNEATVSITVKAVNDNPNITSVTNSGPITEGSPATITVSATDEDNASADLRYSFDCDNNNVFETGPQTANSSTCTFDDNGSPRVNVRVTDGAGGSATDFTKVVVNNVAPTITSITSSPLQALVNQNATFTGTANDPSNADKQAGFFWQWSTDGGSYSPASVPSPFVANSNQFTTTFSTCGAHNVSAKATDKDGGTSAPFSTNTSVVQVSESHFRAPLNEGMYNTVQKGQVVPVKITVGCGATNVTGLTPSIQLLKGDVSNGNEVGSDPIETLSVSAADSTGFMRQVDGGYLYNLAVPSSIGGKTLQAGDLLTIRVNPFGTQANSNPAGSATYIVLKIRK